MEMKYLRNVVTLKYDKNKCSGCGMCTEVCPHQVFQLVNGKAVVVDRDACMECGACARNCPFSAIFVRPGVGCAYAIMMSRMRKKPEICCSG